MPVLIIIAIILYWSVLYAPFIYDDFVVILQNDLIQHLSHGIGGFIDVWTFQHSRFVSNLSFALNYYFHGFNVFGYHAANLTVHVLNALGVLYLSKLIIKLKGQKDSALNLPFWAALIFLVHPLATESVSFISQRSSALVALFYLCSMICYIQARSPGQTKQKSLVYYFLTAASAILAIFTKETAISLPLALALIDYFFFQKRPSLLVICMLVVSIFALLLSFDFQWKSILLTNIYSQSHLGDLLTPGTYLLTQLRVLVLMLRLIFVPYPLNVDYEFPASQSLFEPETFFGMMILLSLIYLGYEIRKLSWALAFSIFWFFISLLGHIYPPRANVIAEHKLYLSLILIVPLLCYAVSQKLSPSNFRKLAITIVGVFCALTLYRNWLWADPVRFWQDTARQSPLKGRVYLNLAISYLNKGQYSLSLENLNKAADLQTPSKLLYRLRGLLLLENHQEAKALEDLNLWLSWYPKDTEILSKRADIYFKTKQYELALRDYNQLIALNPQGVYFYNRSILYELLGNRRMMQQDRTKAGQLGMKPNR